MGNEWILDVLRDLRRFADANGMARLADRIDEASHVAASEISAPHGAGRGTDRAGADGQDGVMGPGA